MHKCAQAVRTDIGSEDRDASAKFVAGMTYRLNVLRKSGQQVQQHYRDRNGCFCACGEDNVDCYPAEAGYYVNFNHLTLHQNRNLR